MKDQPPHLTLKVFVVVIPKEGLAIRAIYDRSALYVYVFYAMGGLISHGI